MKKFLPFCFIHFCTCIHGQTGLNSSEIHYEYKKEDVLISVSGEKLNISHDIYERKKFKEAASASYATEYVYNRSFSSISGLKARVGQPKSNGKYTETFITDISLLSDFSSYVFYSDDSYYEIPFPNMEAGGYTEIEYKLKVDDPHFFKPFYFSEYYPVADAAYSITADTSISIGWKIFGEMKDAVVFDKRPDGDKWIYTWSLKNLPGVKEEEDDGGFLSTATHIIVYIKKYRSHGKEYRVLENTADLFSWYQGLIGQIRPSDNGNLTALTQRIISDASTEYEKASLIFRWVQENIRYIAFEDGWRGFIPYPAAEIFEKRYGDCKDMTHLMYEMMRAVNLDVRHAWVGTRGLPYTYDETPCPSVDNHMVIGVFINDSIYILDATDGYTPFGVPTSFILSKETIFASGTDSGYQIYKIPEYTPEFCTIREDVFMEMDNSVAVSGTAAKTIETFEYSTFHNLYNSAGTEKDKFLSVYLQLGPNNFELMNPSISDTVEGKQTVIAYGYSIPSYVRVLGTSSFINLNLTRPLNQDKLQPDRKNQFEIDYKKQFETTVKFRIPQGKTIPALPAQVSDTFSVGSYSASYEQQDQYVVYTRIITIDRLVIKPVEFQEWNNFITGLQKIYSTSLEIKE